MPAPSVACSSCFHGDEPRIAAGKRRPAAARFEVTLRQTAASPGRNFPNPCSTHRDPERGKSVILDDALAQIIRFSADVYICQKHARSVLCLPPGERQAKLIGVLYLENNLASHVFTPRPDLGTGNCWRRKRRSRWRNARLYNDLQEREARIRRLVDSNIIGVLIWDSQGRIIEANQAFLDIVGYAREDLVSGRLRWTELTRPGRMARRRRPGHRRAEGDWNRPTA